MSLGVPKESHHGERRVGVTPDNVAKLKAFGFEVIVERGAGALAGFDDARYTDAGAAVVDTAAAWSADVVVKVRPPTLEEVASLKRDAVLISLIQPAQNEALVRALATAGVTTIALDRIPRITRAQKMDVLSSMANIAGYRAVLEAANALSGFMGAQVTAAGTDPPAKVLIIGAGVAGLAAVGAARALGAEVRAFDVRAATKEQVESLGAKFLTVEIAESGEGAGGYAKTMSKEFIDAEMALFMAQAKEVDVIITTALVPGTKAPVLITSDMLEVMRPGSVVVDLAAEQGGNCEATVPEQLVTANGVRVIGFTDLPSRMATTASRFFSTNVRHLLDDMSKGGGFKIDLEDEVVRGAVQTHGGEVLPPPPPPKVQPPKPKPSRPPVDAKPKQQAIMDPTRRAWGTTFGGLVLLGVLFVIGRFAPNESVQHFPVFVLACFVGWQVVWSVNPALHTPLMSVTNAISGIIIVGGMLQAGAKDVGLATILGAVAIFVASINIAGGFLVTQRMLRMFRRGG
ncbi:MAG: Re/Si-specific NAD(P)(+) transhydrogenase subunit alpha [Myxococcales bacterium]|nr:Re/Si-specific NAD(P)(+) transhydrogenase subunit alpha [Myxococcales bacterium]